MITINQGRAMEIASWFQSPGTEGHNLKTLATDGVIDCGLIDDIMRAKKADTGRRDDKHGIPLIEYLERLEAYVRLNEREWRHSIIAGSMVVPDEDIATVNADREIRCERCGVDWSPGAYGKI